MTSRSSNIPAEKKIFIVSIILLPILFMYATPIPGFTVGDAFLVFSLLFLIIRLKNVRIEKKLIVCFVYIVIQFILLFLLGSLQRPTTSLHYIVYFVGMLLMPNIRECGYFAIKVLKHVGSFAIILLFVQYVALQFLGIIIPGLLTFLPMTDVGLMNYSEGFQIAGRCMSLFAEPSHYAIYIILFLVCELFEKKGFNFKDLKVPLLISVSIILCASFTGFIGMIAAWGLKLLYEMRKKRVSFMALLSIALISGLMIIVLFNTEAGSYLTNEDVYSVQSEGRFIGYITLQEDLSGSGLHLLFGFGMNDTGSEFNYLPGWPRLIYYYGIIGALIYVVSFIGCVKKRTLSQIVLIVIAGLMIGTEMNFASFIMPYMLIISIFNKTLYTSEYIT